MKLKVITITLFLVFILNMLFIPSIQSFKKEQTNLPTIQAVPIIANHNVTNWVRFDAIPEEAIETAKDTLHIAYGHTSHGSQIITGMDGLPAYKESMNGTEGLYNWNDGPLAGYLDIDDYFVDGDLGNPDFTTWSELTRAYLNESENSEVNVVLWSWCGQVSGADETDINTYLSLMTDLEIDYPDVKFVYMTGHTDGTGYEGNLHLRNNQIRDYCIANNKILFDFEDIECFDPDGTDFGQHYVTDECYYDSTGDGNPDDSNWAIEWQDSHPGQWYDCSPAHTQPLNGNLKAYAAWWLWARLAGWENNSTPTSPTNQTFPTPTIGPIFGGILGFISIFLIGITMVNLVKSKKK